MSVGIETTICWLSLKGQCLNWTGVSAEPTVRLLVRWSLYAFWDHGNEVVSVYSKRNPFLCIFRIVLSKSLRVEVCGHGSTMAHRRRLEDNSKRQFSPFTFGEAPFPAKPSNSPQIYLFLWITVDIWEQRDDPGSLLYIILCFWT